MTLILSGTDGLSDVDGSAATPAIRGTDANTGIFFPAADTIAFSEGGAEVARFNADAQFVAAAGTAALPVITTTGDVNTGIFFPAADTIAFSEGGVEAARFDSAGNFGLGVTPAAWALSGASALQIKNAGFAGYLNNAYVSANQNFTIAGASTYIANGFATLYTQSAGEHRWNNAASGTAGNTISFTQAMTLDASGNLGIGTSSPTLKLDVFQDQNAASHLRIRNNDSGSSAYAGVVVNANGNTWGMRMGSSAANSNALQFVLDALNTPSVKATIDASGNFSVTGTITSGKGADVASTGSMTLGTGNFFDITGTTTISNIAIKPAGTVVYLKFAASLSLQTGGVGTSGALRLTGGATLGVTQYDVLMLISDGTNWWQVAVNDN